MIFSICTIIGINANNLTKIDSDMSKIQEVIVNIPSNVYLYQGEDFGINVYLYQGEDFGINIRTVDSDLYKDIKYEIKNDKLYIDFKNYRLNEYDNLNPEDIRINIQAPNEIKKIRTNSNLLVAISNKNTNATNNGKN